MIRSTRITLSAFAAGLALAAGAVLANDAALRSGVDRGGQLSAFQPTHVTGADKGTQTCPVCKYPSNPAVQVWVNTDDTRNVTAIATALEKATRQHADKHMKAFVVFMNPGAEPSKSVEAKLQKIATTAGVQNVGLVYLPSPKHEAVVEYRINTDPQVKNTVFVYKNRTVDAKFINFVADARGLAELKSALHAVLQ